MIDVTQICEQLSTDYAKAAQSALARAQTGTLAEDTEVEFPLPGINGKLDSATFRQLDETLMRAEHPYYNHPLMVTRFDLIEEESQQASVRVQFWPKQSPATPTIGG